MQAALPDDDAAQVAAWARGGAAGVTSTLLGVALSMVWQFILARVLGPAGLGLISLGSSVFVALTALLPLGMDAGALRYVSFHLGRKDASGVLGVIRSAVYVSLGLGLLVTPILIWQSNRIALQVFSKPELGSILQILFLGLPLSMLLQVLASVLQGFQKVAAQALIQQVLVPTLRIVGVGVLVLGLRSFSLDAVAAVIVVASACGAFMIALAVWRAARASVTARQAPAAPDAALYRYSARAVVIAAVEQLNVVVPVFLLGILSLSSQIGIFGAAFRSSLVIGLFLVGLNLIAAPASSSLLAAGDTASVAALYRTITRWGLTLALPVFLVVLLLPADVMGIFGPDFRAGALTLQILVLGQLISVGTGPCRWMLNVSDHQRLNVLNGGLGLVTALSLGLWLIPSQGARGAAIASACAAAITNLVGLVQTQRVLQLHPYDRTFIKPILAGLAAAVIVFSARQELASTSPFARLILSGAAGLAVYAMVLMILRPEAGDREAFRTMLRLKP